MSQVSPLAPKEFAELPPLAGVKLAATSAEIKYKGRKDLLLMTLDEGTQSAGVYTRSLSAAAPIEWCRQVAPNARAAVINAGNANAFTGQKGVEAVQAIADKAADVVGCSPHQVYVASTGVIGVPLPYGKITASLEGLHSVVDANQWQQAAEAIMTTDTFPKLALRETKIGKTPVRIQGICKGSGMIAPDMATMLAYIFTDADIAAPVLKTMLSRGTHRSFNSITVDSDTSTSDMALLFATGKAGNKQITDAGDPALDDFKEALYDLLEDLAKQIIRDGEGATKFITVNVTGAEDDEAARRIGLAIGNSPLVKTAVAGEDPNWGRIVAAVGKSGAWADRDRLRITIGDVLVAENGEVHPEYVEAEAALHMKGQEIRFSVDVGVGVGEATIWTCDLTNRYIEINADYRS